MTFSISSSAFGNGQPIPSKYTCEAENVSPHLSWSNVPSGTFSLALTVEDPDAPLGTWFHWIFYNIPPSITSLNEDFQTQKQKISIGTQGRNSFKKLGYGGPCPPSGKRHRYFFKLYALNLPPDLPEELTADLLRSKISSHIITQAEWMGTYIR